MHDTGKIGIPHKILKKPGPLDPEEWAIMKTHSQLGYDILSRGSSSTFEMAASIALSHHEKWDGSGYPHKLKGEDIHIFARIVMIVDVFDALTSERPYKKAYPLEKTISIMAAGKGEFFDPLLLDIFFKHIDEFISIKQSMCDLVCEEPPMDGLAELAMI
jgi:putative two-component system response regulator